jgi:flagellin
MRLSHNVASLQIYQSYSIVQQNQSIALERISSGSRINSAKDDPSGIAQSERMNMQIKGLQVAGNNAQDGISMLQTADGGLGNITDMLQRIRELVVQAGDGTNTTTGRQSIQNEINQLTSGINDIANDTEFNGKKLLSQSGDSNTQYLEMPVGANPDEKVQIPMYNLSLNNSSSGSGVNLSDIKSIDITSGGQSVDKTLNVIDSAISSVSSIRSKYGALENRFQGTVDNINDVSNKIQSADSSLTDADIAKEMMEYSKDSILSQAGTAMMVQTNKFPQDVLSILGNVRSR